MSGFSALVYQTLWLRLLGLVFGVTVYAASTVLAAFMAGLALGSFLGGRAADRVSSPLRWLGIAELSVAIAALATPALLGALDLAYGVMVHGAVEGNAAGLTLVRFAGSFTVLLIPTTMMGATMPLAIRAVAPAADPNRPTAALYAANTAGAVIGALLTGYYLVGHAGITSTLRFAAAGNLLVAVTALALARRWRAVEHREAVAPATPLGVPVGASRSIVLAVFVLSGFVSLALEIVWFRVLVLFTMATTYAFTTVLAIVLGGIATGSAAAHWWLRRRVDCILSLGLLEMAIGITACGSLLVLAHGFAAGWVPASPRAAGLVAVLPTALLLGAAFPIGVACWVRDAPAAAGRGGDLIGRFYGANLLGGIAGAIVGGFILVPLLGTRAALIGVASLSLGAGLLLTALRVHERPRLAPALLLAGGVAFAVVARLLPDPALAVLARRYPGEVPLWREEGAQSTVSVQQGAHRVLYIDGLHQASDGPAMLAIHRQIGALGLALHPDPRRVLVIGLGGGATAGAVARFPGVSIDLVELSPGVVRAADWLRVANQDVLRQPNVHLHIDDGRQHLQRTDQRYDVIVADLIEPFNAGAGNLYSLEYFRLAARALADDGLMLQWIGLRQEAQYKPIARTFLAAFPYTTLWEKGTLLVGSKRPLTLSRARFAARAQDPQFVEAIAAAGAPDLDGLLAVFTAGPDELRALVGGGPLLTDDHPAVEFFLSLPQQSPGISLAAVRRDTSGVVIP